jgi:hypothetical protein
VRSSSRSSPAAKSLERGFSSPKRVFFPQSCA